MAETVRTADSSGNVENKSEQQLETPTPKSKSAKASGTNAPRPKLNARGVPETNWDNEAKPPTERKSIAEDPEGKSNVK